MYFPESESIARKHQDLYRVVELVDAQLSEVFSSAPLRPADFACAIGADTNQVVSVFELLARHGVLLPETAVECQHCQTLSSAAAFRQALDDEDDFECSHCSRRLRKYTTPITVYRMAAKVAARPKPEADSDGGIAAAKYVFRRHDRGWEITFQGKTALMRDSRGLFYISRLLAEPGRDVPAVSLLAAATGIDSRVPTGSSGSILTDQTRAEYGTRFNDLQEELRNAEQNNDLGNIERLQSEMDALGTEIARATGLGGRKRELTDVERVRKAVSNAVSRAINSFDEKKYKELVQHFRTSISSGRFFKYDPEQSINWLL
jgi:hypothetical protein